IIIEPGDVLIEAKLTRGADDVVLITREGQSIRFSEDDVRAMGRPAAGVRGISLEPSDAVVSLAVVVSDATLLVAGENGIGKRTRKRIKRKKRGRARPQPAWKDGEGQSLSRASLRDFRPWFGFLISADETSARRLERSADVLVRSNTPSAK